MEVSKPAPAADLHGEETFHRKPSAGEPAKCSAWADALGGRATAIEPDDKEDKSKLHPVQ
jgi:hypothetical protein